MTTDSFVFIDPGPLADGELELVLIKVTPADLARDWIPHYEFEMRVGGVKAGRINIRVGNTPAVVGYHRHIGYAVEPEFRGNHYAERASHGPAHSEGARSGRGLDLLQPE